MDLLNPILFAFLAGVLPSLLWLAFWLREDTEHPEPRKYILMAFGYGVLSVPFAFVLQLLFNNIFNIDTGTLKIVPLFMAFGIVLVWAFLEELVKYKAAWFGGLRKAITDEAVDVPIYMISAALGFAALENMLFLILPLINADLIQQGLQYHVFAETAKLRFIGATLVHVASSGLIGIFAGFSLFFMNSMRKRYLIVGLVLASTLHALFNLFIIRNSQNSFAGFLLIWLFILVIIVLFERIKKIKLNTINDVREK